jgi:hypothetical protein
MQRRMHPKSENGLWVEPVTVPLAAPNTGSVGGEGRGGPLAKAVRSGGGQSRSMARRTGGGEASNGQQGGGQGHWHMPTRAIPSATPSASDPGPGGDRTVGCGACVPNGGPGFGPDLQVFRIAGATDSKPICGLFVCQRGSQRQATILFGRPHVLFP